MPIQRRRRICVRQILIKPPPVFLPAPRASLARPRKIGLIGQASPFVYRQKKQISVALTKKHIQQIRKLINRHLHQHIGRDFSAAAVEQLKRGLFKEMDRQISNSHTGLQRELAILRRTWTLAMGAGKNESASPPDLARLAVSGLGSRVPGWLKQRLRFMKRSATAIPGSGRSSTVLLLTPRSETPTRPEVSGSGSTGAGLETLLSLLRVVPEGSPLLRRLVRALRSNNLPVSLLPPKLTTGPGGRRNQNPEKGELRFRKPLAGVLRMRIEPPEAARILAQYLPLGDVPLVFKKVPTRTPQPDSADTSLAGQVNRSPKANGTNDPTISLTRTQLKHLVEETQAETRDNPAEFPASQIQRIADRVFTIIEKRLKVERQRRGLG